VCVSSAASSVFFLLHTALSLALGLSQVFLGVLKENSLSSITTMTVVKLIAAILPLLLVVLLLSPSTIVAAFQAASSFSPPLSLPPSSQFTTSTSKTSYHPRPSSQASTFRRPAIRLSSSSSQQQEQATISSNASNTSSNKKKTKVTTQEEKLSDTDARVLKSMLQDTDKLDLKTEESLKKLLERGVVSKDVPTTPPKKKLPADDMADSEFSSAVLQKLSDTKLWQAVSRRAGDWLESAKLYVVNRVERDALTLAALGLFAWERAVRDVARALPAAGNATTESSWGGTKLPLMLSAKSSSTKTVEEMTTTMDELKSVSTAVVDILRTGGNTDGRRTTASSTITGSGGVLRTAATSRQDKRNFQRAYQRAQDKQSVQRNPVQQTQRAASSVVDTAWELKRELQAEVNQPGYKSKQVQTALEAASDSTKQLLTSAKETWKLGRAQYRERKRLREQGTISPKEDNLVETVFSEEVMAQEEEEGQQQRPTYKYYDEKPPTVSTAAAEVAQQQQQLRQRQKEKLRQEARMRAERVRAEQLEQQKLRAQQQQLQEQKEVLQAMETELQQECHRLIKQLQNCIVNPEQTWLRPDVIEGVREFDQTMIRQVVTEMIATRNGLKTVYKNNKRNDADENNNNNVALYLDQMETAKQQIEAIANHAQQAVSLGAANMLTHELLVAESPEGFSSSSSSNDLIPVLLRLDELQQQLDRIMLASTGLVVEEETGLVEEEWMQSTVEEAEDAWFYQEDNDPDLQSESAVDDNIWFATTANGDREPESFYTSNSVPSEQEQSTTKSQIMDVIPDAFVYAVATTDTSSAQTAATSEEDDPTTTSKTTDFSSVVEVVTDEDFEAAVGQQAKRAVTVDLEADETNAVEEQKKKEENMFLVVVLRSLDILFFLLEKTFTVRTL
jgi:hypothetical protein